MVDVARFSGAGRQRSWDGGRALSCFRAYGLTDQGVEAERCPVKAATQHWRGEGQAQQCKTQARSICSRTRQRVQQAGAAGCVVGLGWAEGVKAKLAHEWDRDFPLHDRSSHGQASGSGKAGNKDEQQTGERMPGRFRMTDVQDDRRDGRRASCLWDLRGTKGN